MKTELIESPLSPEKIRTALSAGANSSFEDNFTNHLRFTFSFRRRNFFEKEGLIYFWQKTKTSRWGGPVLIAEVKPFGQGPTVRFSIHSSPVGPALLILIFTIMLGFFIYDEGICAQSILGTLGFALPASAAFWLIRRHEKKHTRLAFEAFFRQETATEK